MLPFDLFTQIKDVMLKHVLDQTAALPRRNKCQHDEGEDSNAVLSLLHCLVDTKGEAGVMNVQQRQTHFYLSPPVCGGGGGGGQSI